VLEYAKDRFSVVDPLEQPMPLRVHYGMTCLLIRDDIDSMSCSVAWGTTQCFALDGHGARGARVKGNLSTARWA
jgi:hypothetical protein